MDREVWIIGIVAVGFVTTFAVVAFSPDSIAQRIEACMTQPNTVFNSEGCFPADRAPQK